MGGARIRTIETWLLLQKGITSMSLKNWIGLYRTEPSDLFPPPNPLDPAILRAPHPKPARKRSSISPTQRSLKHLREAGYLCQVTEHWNQWARVRQDLFGFIDILAIRDGEILAVQACIRSDVSTRAAKIDNHHNVGAARKAGIRTHVRAWGTLGGHRSANAEMRDG